MSASLRFLLALLVLVVLVSGGFYVSDRLRPTAAAPAQAQAGLPRTKPTVAGLYQVSIEPENATVPQGELHAWVLTLRTPDGKAVDGAEIAVDGGMPAHNHGLPTSPKVTAALGEGRYRIDGVRFNMGGRWELRFAISGAAGTDAVAFDLDV
ncbi:MAG: FixH family protein [Rhizobiaceae bacterium]|nr:FixH family protein [Rhizobiaceae bacterium]